MGAIAAADDNDSSTDVTINYKNEKILMIRNNNEKYLKVCDSNWDKHHSDLICEKLGFAESVGHSIINSNRTLNRNADDTDASDVSTNEFFILKTNRFNGSILTQLDITNSCPGNNVITLSCMHYGESSSSFCFRPNRTGLE